MQEKSVALIQCEVVNAGLLKIDRIGAGIGVIIFDKAHHIAAGFHVLAARSRDIKPQNSFMYADTAVPQALAEISQKGGKAPFSVAIAGGAALLREDTPEHNAGNPLIEAAREVLKKAGLEITAEETGGNNVRCMLLDIDAEKIKIT